MNFNLANKLTLLRIILIPIFILVFYLPYTFAPWLCIIIFLGAAVTDFLDGVIARGFKQTTDFGKFLDPVADKLIIIIALVLLTGRMNTIFFTIPVALIIAREVAVSALREWMASYGKSDSVSVAFIGKFKTFFQMAAIVAFLYYPFATKYNFWVAMLSYLLLYSALMLTYWSMINYFRSSWHVWKEKS